MLTDYLRLRDDRVEVGYFAPDRPFAEATVDVLVEALARLSRYFELAETLPRIRAILAPNRDAFDVLVADLLHVEIERPSDPRRVAQTQKTDIVLVSPSAYPRDSAYPYDSADFDRLIVHELVHVCQESISPGIEESPLWWDEGLAVYLSGQWRYESPFRFREPVLEGFRAGRVPTLAAIQTDRSLAYAFGWTVIRFLEQQKGREAIVRVVRQMRDGDVFAALGEDPHRFEAAWTAWLLSGAALRFQP